MLISVCFSLNMLNLSISFLDNQPRKESIEIVFEICRGLKTRKKQDGQSQPQPRPRPQPQPLPQPQLQHQRLIGLLQDQGEGQGNYSYDYILHYIQWIQWWIRFCVVCKIVYHSRVWSKRHLFSFCSLVCGWGRLHIKEMSSVFGWAILFILYKGTFFLPMWLCCFFVEAIVGKKKRGKVLIRRKFSLFSFSFSSFHFACSSSCNNLLE